MIPRSACSAVSLTLFFDPNPNPNPRGEGICEDILVRVTVIGRTYHTKEKHKPSHMFDFSNPSHPIPSHETNPHLTIHFTPLHSSRCNIVG
mmetsp:Transcript_10684/g.17485  ORF Transcript_10684/g.17485 Transcript_10684/m.17485 type:complete len:91 (+) Transcript_10684:816-1088(+)